MDNSQNYLGSLKKGLKDYLLEFFLLFTAVTLGFFAENIRERIAEQQKKQELLAAVILDFETDKSIIEIKGSHGWYKKNLVSGKIDAKNRAAQKYAASIGENAVHGSDSDENAAIESAFHFSGRDMF